MSGRGLRLPSGLTRRARAYLTAHAIRRETWSVEQHRRHWHRYGRPADAVEHLAAYQGRWGGLELPPTPEYEGGPQVLDADDPSVEDGLGPCFEAGSTRCSTAYRFMVDGAGRFGIVAEDSWVPLHGSVEGWVEAAALRQLADGLPAEVRMATGARIDGLPERYGLRPVPEVAGVTDGWWRGKDSLLAIYRGEARLFGNLQYQTAYLYLGIDDLTERLRLGIG
ncbi:hypothetical protein [Catellatospora citrea]|uniref:Uncharacterized protein n=1 Tax=Catellatospora citrea TaxID=53366 RepID=A0A8J3P0Y9_9ACTN|nr:hypothetical protein [Catellatospora citrea]RKE11489.1 hypothetical protein C8E86_6417 [Catellatospora citrea]GIF99988.1 hypothetical protein Cci01nite_50820 [Catellatospora citrea]